MGVPYVLCVLVSTVIILSQAQFLRRCTADLEYRTLNGRCSSLVNSEWAASGQVLSTIDSRSNSRRSSPLPSSIITFQPQHEDPVTEWLSAWLSFIKSDLLSISEDYRGLINVATTVLDLSNLYGTSGDIIHIDPRIIGDHWDIGEQVLWKLLEAEHYRITEALTQLNNGWGTNKIHQEARKIVIGEYQNIIIKEVAPLLIGQRTERLKKAVLVNTTEDISAVELLTGLHADLAMGASQLNSLTVDLLPVEQIWQSLVTRMLTLNVLIPGGGVTMNKLNELSDTLDILENIEPASWTEATTKCALSKLSEGLPETKRNVGALLGGLLQTSESGAVLSKTLSCLVEKILQKVISGDRFWVEKKSSGFTDEQMTSLAKVKLSSLICANLPRVKPVQPNAFLMADYGLNAPLDCDTIPELDIKAWVNNQVQISESEEEEISQAIRTATDRLIEFRRYEYDLFNDNFIAAKGSGLSALNAVTKPSVGVLNAMNESILFELVTYEFMRHPNLAPLVNVGHATPRKKRAADIVGNSFHTSSVNLPLNSRIKSSLNSIPQNRIYYKSTKTVVDASGLSSSTKTSSSSPNSFSNDLPKPLTFEVSTKLITGPTCDPSEQAYDCSEFSRYRSYSGWCNNIENPEWGMSKAVHKRLLPSEYDDKISSPRTTSVRGSKLPSPRVVSRAVHYDIETLDPKYTLMLMQWGQFIDHDFAHTPTQRGFHATALQCGDCQSKNIHPACFPIPIPPNDDFFTPFNPSDDKCIPFSRSMPGQHSIGPREQINQLTSYLDASMVYGNDECEMRKLRQQGTYLLKTSNHPHNSHTKKYKDLLPRTRENSECFSPSGECFMAGDGRVNEQPGLTCLHTVFVREHNKIAKKLATLNPHWDVNKVFEETRRIVAAEVQHITYNEFLPRVMGLNNLKLFDLDLEQSGYYFGYEDSCSATTFTEFASAAFRFGHSMIRPTFTVMSESAMRGRSLPEEISLRRHFNKPDILMKPFMVDDLLRGLAMTPMESLDTQVSEELTNHLFEQRKPKSGLDLVSLNLQRARDHGIAGYNKYREVCKLTRARLFIDLKQEIPVEIINKLQKVYKHPDDIDLFTGLLSEKRLPGALVGPTLACLIGVQFKHFRKCDRYWYETSDPDVKFSRDQLKELKSTSLAALVCSNMEDMDTMISRSTMDQSDRLTNPLVNCKRTIRHLNLEPWRQSSSSDRFSSSSDKFSSSSDRFSSTSDRGSSGSLSHIISKSDTGSSSHTSVCQINDQSILLGKSLRISPCTICLCTSKAVRCSTINLSETNSSCLSLVREFSIKEVEEDESCRAQCRIY